MKTEFLLAGIVFGYTIGLLTGLEHFSQRISSTR